MTRIDLARASDLGSGIPAGTSFPGSPSTDDLFHRTDRDLLYFYDGSQWLTIQLFQIEMKNEQAQTWPTTAGATAMHRGTVPYGGVYSVYLLSWYPLSQVLTTNNGSNYWTAELFKFNTAGSSTSLGTFNTSADTAGTAVQKTLAINAALGSFVGFFSSAGITAGAPGAFRLHGGHILCRLIG